MHTLRETLVHFPILALFLAIGIGYLLGEISFFGFRLGIAGVLFAGLAIGALDHAIALPEIVPTLGLIVFVYMVGLHSGPTLVEIIRRRGYRDSVYPAATIAKIILAQLLVSMIPLAKGADTPAGIEPVARPAAAKRPPLVKLIRPGISGVATLPAVHGWLLVENFSREANAAGVATTGMTGFVEYAVSKRLGLFAAPTHWTRNRGVNGFGDIAFGPKLQLNRESRLIPLVAIGYSYKQPAATHNLGSGFVDHKAMFYADKNFGPRRLTANFVTKWEGHKEGFVRQYLESLALLTPVRGRVGMAAQTFYSTSRLARYGGAVAAGVYSFRPNLTVHLGLEHGFGPKSADLGVVWGMTYLYHPVRH